MSKRKPHNENAGYIAERQYNGAHIVIYNALDQGISLSSGQKYAIVCEKHHCVTGATSVPKAREVMKFPDFCEECMGISDPNLENRTDIVPGWQRKSFDWEEGEEQ